MIFPAMFSPRSIFILLFTCSTVVASSQKATIRATIDKNKIILGEPMVLTIEAQMSPGDAPRFVEIDSIPHFEMIEKPDIDTIRNGNIFMIRGVYKLTSFDSGHWVIPAFSLSRTVKTDTLPVDVTFSDFDPEQAYHDIKEIIEVKPKAKKQWWWYAIGGVLLLSLLVIYLLKRKKPVQVTKPKLVLNAFDEAMNELEQLQSNKPDARQFYTGLVDIFRLYIFRRKNILSLQKTTDDLVVQLKSLGIEKEQYNRLSQALRMADFVKFAKYVPGGEDDRNSFQEIRNAIMTIEEQIRPPETEQKKE